MINIFLIIFFVILFLLFFYSKRNRRLGQKTTISPTYLPFLKEQEFNPDISTDNWDLHKLRLEYLASIEGAVLSGKLCAESIFNLFLEISSISNNNGH